MAGVSEISDVNGFKSYIKDHGSQLSVVHFSANWAPQCQQMHDVMVELTKDVQCSNVKFIKIEAEDLPEISEEYEISAVPTFVFIRNEKLLDKLDGANAAELTKKVKTLVSQTVVNVPTLPTQAKKDINTRLKELINAADVMLFMKGSPAEPKCGFSKQMIQILKDANVEYSTFNILTDDEVRQAITTFRRCSDLQSLKIGEGNVSVQSRGILFLRQGLSKQDRPSHFGTKIFVPSFPDNKKLDPKRAFAVYLKLTEKYRKKGENDETNLFLSFIEPHKPVSKQTVAKWIVSTIKLAYEGHIQVRAHSTRALGPSWALFKGANMTSILEAADWSRESTFIKFYLRDVKTHSLIQD